MNKQEAIEKIKDLYSFVMEDGPFEVDFINKRQAIDIISKIDEPQKQVVPKFVADVYESIKDDFENKVYDLCLQFNRDNGELSSEVDGWFDFEKNEPIQTLVKMKLYGYEVEQEKLYTVEIPNPNNEYSMNVLIRLPSSGKIALVALHKPNTSYLKNKEYQLTEAEIKQDFDFLWQFAKEVE